MVFVGFSVLKTAVTDIPVSRLPSFSRLIIFVQTPSTETA